MAQSKRPHLSKADFCKNRMEKFRPAIDTIRDGDPEFLPEHLYWCIDMVDNYENDLQEHQFNRLKFKSSVDKSVQVSEPVHLENPEIALKVIKDAINAMYNVLDKMRSGEMLKAGPETLETASDHYRYWAGWFSYRVLELTRAKKWSPQLDETMLARLKDVFFETPELAADGEDDVEAYDTNTEAHDDDDGNTAEVAELLTRAIEDF